MLFNSLFSSKPWSSGSVLDHISLPPVFESRRGHIWRLFRLSLRLITVGSRSAHLAYRVHKSGRKTSSLSKLFYVSYYSNTRLNLCIYFTLFCRVGIETVVIIEMFSKTPGFWGGEVIFLSKNIRTGKKIGQQVYYSNALTPNQKLHGHETTKEPVFCRACLQRGFPGGN